MPGRVAATVSFKCMAMGYPFVKRHAQSDMVIFAIVEESCKETFEKAWQETVLQKPHDEQAEPLGDQQTLQLPPPTETPTPRPKPKPKPTVEPATTPVKEKNEPPPPDNITKKELSSLISSAGKTKSLFLNVSHAALDVMQQIETEPGWSWAKGKELPLLREQVNTLKAALRPMVQGFVA